MSDDIDPTTITNSSITLKQGSSTLPERLHWPTTTSPSPLCPPSPLTASKLYNVSVGGFNDIEGNTVTTFTQFIYHGHRATAADRSL